MDKAKKIKIRRSSGEVQYVTQEELDALNDRRKRRDQERGWGKVSNPVQSLFKIILFLLGITVLFLWIRS
tara:strand:+ start:262 stop:471 length:210 start_codon:yes stop_codon:yes gene_type:complete